MNGENNSVIEHNNEIRVKNNVFHQAQICKECLADRAVWINPIIQTKPIKVVNNSNSIGTKPIKYYVH